MSGVATNEMFIFLLKEQLTCLFFHFNFNPQTPEPRRLAKSYMTLELSLAIDVNGNFICYDPSCVDQMYSCRRKHSLQNRICFADTILNAQKERLKN